MGYSRYSRKETKIFRPHPFWKPIGFLLMVIVPLFSFALADISMKWLIENLENFDLHPIFTSNPVNIWGDWIVMNLPGTILITLIYSIFLFLILSLLNSIIYSLNKDKNLSALNVPPIKRKKKKKKLRDI